MSTILSEEAEGGKMKGTTLTFAGMSEKEILNKTQIRNASKKSFIFHMKETTEINKYAENNYASQ